MPWPPYDTYRDQLTPLFFGHALWDPDPANLYESVSIGDVGYIREGYFIRMFNVILEWDDPSNNRLLRPDPYTCLNMGPFTNIRKSRFSNGEYYSRAVNITELTSTLATTPDE